MPARYLVDTNVLVRFLTGEPPAMANKAKAFFAAADAGEFVIEIPPLIVAETVYTLESYYKVPVAEVAEKLGRLLRSRGIETWERDRMCSALDRHCDQNVHFANAYLAAACAERFLPIASFDRDLDKFADARRVEPGSDPGGGRLKIEICIDSVASAVAAQAGS
jgi:predicted nucleic acid-binding protein